MTVVVHLLRSKALYLRTALLMTLNLLNLIQSRRIQLPPLVLHLPIIKPARERQ